MTNHPIISSKARNAYPGDPVRIMTRIHRSRDGERWEVGTEYTPQSLGVHNDLRGSPTIQTVSIGAQTVEFVGRANATVHG